LPAVARAFSFWRAHGPRIRRARMLCQCADGLRLRRVPSWEARSNRLYRRTARNLRGLATGAAVGAGDPSADPAAAAHRALADAQGPYWSGAAGLVTLAAALAAGALLVLLIGSAVSPALRGRLFPRDLARGRPWTASSAEPGYDTHGVGPSSRGPLFFHTTNSDHPWLEIDLGDEHLIRSVLIKNRADCCAERSMPLNVEVFDGARWNLIAQRRSPFSVWEYDVPPVRARRVRVRLAGTGYLHLRRISIYGQ
jgi:hypothetical protein